MIDATPSLQATKGLRATALTTYLLASGWTARPSRVDGISIFSKDVDGVEQVVEFPIPVKTGFAEEQRRVADALRILEVAEGRALAKIVSDIRHVGEATSVAETGDYGLKVIEAARTNINSAFDFAEELLSVRSVSEVMELSTDHARKQIEILTTQTKDLAALAQKFATETAVPIKEGVNKDLEGVG